MTDSPNARELHALMGRHPRFPARNRPLTIVLVASLSFLFGSPFGVAAVDFHGSVELKFAFTPRGGGRAVSSDTTRRIATVEETGETFSTNATTTGATPRADTSLGGPGIRSADEVDEYLKAYRFPLCRPGDGSDKDVDGLPGRYLRMHKGDREKAKAALRNTLEWRAKHGVDTILERPHPTYDICKEVFPHYFCGRDPGDHVVFVQRPGSISMPLAKANDVDTHDILMHYVFVLEYCWNIIEPRPDQTMTSVIDLDGIHFGSVMEMLPFVKQFVSMMSAHFPQRSHKTLLVNTPRWFGTLYRLISPLLRESTKSKIEIYHGGKKQDKALRSYLGDLAPSELLSQHTQGVTPGASDERKTGLNSPLEQGLRAFCTARLHESGQEMQVIIR